MSKFNEVFLFVLFIFIFLASCTGEKIQLPENKKPKDDLKEKLLAMNVSFSQEEITEIQNYIKEDSLTTYLASPLSFWYNIKEEGSGEKIKIGDRVQVLYDLQLLDGTLCFSFEEKGAATIVVGKFSQTKALDEALLLLKEEGSGIFIFPSSLAYGVAGKKPCIPPWAPVIYNIVSVKKI